MPNWSAKAEYLYYDLGGINISMPQISINPAAGAFSAARSRRHFAPAPKAKSSARA